MSNIIYIITNTINDKVYIGQTKQFEKRKKKHFYNAKQDKQFHIYRAIRKYGVDKFNIIPICSVINEQDLNDVEIEFIKEFDSFKNGYNMTLGGGMIIMSQKTKEKIRNTLLGVKHSQTRKDKISKNRIGLCKGVNNGNHQGKWVTPWGIFNSLSKAIKSSNYKIGRDTLSHYCRYYGDKRIGKLAIYKSKILTENMFGKTFKEVGFDFI